MRNNKIYDINFTLEEPACMTVEAHSLKEAREVGEEELNKISKKELIERLLAAVDYGGLKITSIERAD